MQLEDTPLISRRALFGNPDRTSVQISPTGTHLAWLAPLDGVLNLWVAPREDIEAARPITHDTGRGIHAYFWAYTAQHLLYIQDKNGDENWRLYAVDLSTDGVADLTPFDDVQARVFRVSQKHPTEAIVGLNQRQAEWHDVFRLNIITGERTLVLQHDRFLEVIVDDDYRVRLAAQMTEEGALELYRPAGGDWILWATIPAEDMLTTSPIDFDKANRAMYFKDSRGRDTAAVVELDPNALVSRVLAEDVQADADDVVLHPTEKHVQAVSFIYDRKRWQILDPAVEPDFAYLETVADGDVEIVSRTLADDFWVVAYLVDKGPERFYLYDRSRRKAQFLFTNRESLAHLPLVRMHPVVIRSRDGLDLVSYYSLPATSDEDGDGIPDSPLPLVLIPHGGPWYRDFWGFDPLHQWLANRGYAVLAVNFRSSTGFGKHFINAGNLEWGGKILEDQLDAVHWAIAQGIADASRIAVLGGSFGGYSTLAGLTFAPEVFACGVDVVGPSNLITLLESMPPYWKPMLEQFTTRVGDHRTEQGRALLIAHSPLTFVDRIRRPLLIGQGANDPRVKQAESDQIVQAMKAKDLPVTYVLYPDEGHGFARPENNLSFFAIADVFLATHLGGRCEPLAADLIGSSLTVPAGAEEVPGLPEALANA